MDKSQIEYLENCLSRKWDKNILHLSDVWYQSHDTLITVANILDEEGYFAKPFQVISFFEKPHKWESDMQEIVNEYHEELRRMKING